MHLENARHFLTTCLLYHIAFQLSSDFEKKVAQSNRCFVEDSVYICQRLCGRATREDETIRWLEEDKLDSRRGAMGQYSICTVFSITKIGLCSFVNDVRPKNQEKK